MERTSNYKSAATERKRKRALQQRTERKLEEFIENHPEDIVSISLSEAAERLSLLLPENVETYLTRQVRDILTDNGILSEIRAESLVANARRKFFPDLSKAPIDKVKTSYVFGRNEAYAVLLMGVLERRNHVSYAGDKLFSPVTVVGLDTVITTELGVDHPASQAILRHQVIE